MGLTFIIQLHSKVVLWKYSQSPLLNTISKRAPPRLQWKVFCSELKCSLPCTFIWTPEPPQTLCRDNGIGARGSQETTFTRQWPASHTYLATDHIVSTASIYTCFRNNVIEHCNFKMFSYPLQICSPQQCLHIIFSTLFLKTLIVATTTKNIFLIRILIINLQGTPLLPAVTSPSSSPLATSYTASWTTYSISPVLEYELAYKNKWDRVSISRNMPQYKCEWL